MATSSCPSFRHRALAGLRARPRPARRAPPRSHRGEAKPCACTLANLSRIAFAIANDDIEKADALASESVAFARESGDLEQILDMTSMIGVVRIQQGRMAQAVSLEREVVQLADQFQHKGAFRSCCEDLALMLVRCGNPERAAQLLGKAQALREELGRGDLGEGELTQVHPLLAGAVAEVRRALSEEAWIEAMSIGRSADLQDLLEAALRDSETAARHGSPRK